MATTNLNITGGIPPYTITVTKAGEDTNRFVSYVGNVLTFNADNTVNSPYTYYINVEDANGCITSTVINLACPYECGVLPTIENVTIDCDTYSANLEFDITSDTDVQVEIHNPVNGAFFWQSYPAGSHTINAVIPKDITSFIEVYKQNTEFQCKSSHTLNPSCIEDCTFSFTVGTPVCSEGTGSILLTPTHSEYNVEIYESTNFSVNLFQDRIGNLIYFSPIMDGNEHTYHIIGKQIIPPGIDPNAPMDCEYSTSFTLTCGNPSTPIQCENLDIVLCLDNSGSISGNPLNPGLYKSAVQNIIDALKPNIENGDVKIGVVKFGNDAEILNELSSDYTQIQNSINSLTFKEGATNLCKGIAISRNVLKNPNTVRNCNKLMLVITDGIPNKSCDSLFSSVQAKQQARTEVNLFKTIPYVGSDSKLYWGKIMIVGITSNVDQNFLKELASTPSDYRHSPSFNNFAEIAYEIAESLCSTS